jgi:hypothetical protein
MSLAHWILAASVVLAAVLAIRAHHLDAAGRWQVYVFKPLATLLVFALALAFPEHARSGADTGRLSRANCLFEFFKEEPRMNTIVRGNY